jgi:hypothetical protein
MARLNSILALACLLPMSGIAQHISSGPIMRTLGTPPQPDNTLILQYKFTEGSGTTIDDSSSNGYDGSLNGATWVTGKSGSGFALQFDGNDWAQTASITFGTSIITICAWVWWDAFADDDDLLLEHTTDFNGGDNRFIINPNESSSSKATGMMRSGGGYRKEDHTRWSAATWTHLAWVLDNSTTAGDVKLYIDGSLAGSTISINTKNGNGNFTAAVIYLFSRAGSSLFGAGRLDDFRIYSGELTPTEVGYVKDDPQ